MLNELNDLLTTVLNDVPEFPIVDAEIAYLNVVARVETPNHEDDAMLAVAFN